MDRPYLMLHPAEAAFAREHSPRLFDDYQVIEQARIVSAPQLATPREVVLAPAPAPRASRPFLAARLTSVAAAMQGL